jgi:hypothetical protein
MTDRAARIVSRLRILGVDTIFALVLLEEELPAGMEPILGPPGVFPRGTTGWEFAKGLA